MNSTILQSIYDGLIQTGFISAIPWVQLSKVRQQQITNAVINKMNADGIKIKQV